MSTPLLILIIVLGILVYAGIHFMLFALFKVGARADEIFSDLTKMEDDDDDKNN